MTDNPVPDCDDLARLDNVLADTATSPVTRRALLGRAAVGAAGVGALGALGPAAALASPRRRRHHGHQGGEARQIDEIITAAVTAEALAVTYLTGLIGNAQKIGIPASLVPVLKAANAAELDHYNVLRGLGAKPLTTKFWAPNAFFASADAAFATIEYAETQFVNAYLIGVTAFARAGKDSLARYAAEILGTEAEHRALARFAQGKLPNDVGFEAYDIHTIGGIVAALEKAGIGFGKQGKGPGAFYEFATPPATALTALSHNQPA